MKFMTMLTWMYASIKLMTRVLTNIWEKFEAGARMIIHAVLLMIAKISTKRDSSRAVAILPEMRLGAGDGVVISNPISKFEVWLTGNVDYGIVQYEPTPANKGLLIFVMSLSTNPLGSEGIGRECFSGSRVIFSSWTFLSR
jgi:hypothetical protein